MKNTIIVIGMILSSSISFSQFVPSSTGSNNTNIGTNRSLFGIGLDDPQGIVRHIHIRKNGFATVAPSDPSYLDYSLAIRLDPGIGNESGEPPYSYKAWDVSNYLGRFDLYNVNQDRVDFSIVNQTGYTGIGVTNPQGRLDVHSGYNGPSDALWVGAHPLVGNQGGIMHHQYAEYAWHEIAQNTSYETNSTLRFNFTNRTSPGETVKSNIFVIHSAGRVGVNTATPTVAMEVLGAVKIKGGVYSNWTAGQWSERIYLPIGGAIVTETTSSISNKHLGFGMTDGGWYFITGSDPLGSMNNPTKYAMSVSTEGKLTTREIEVNHVNWPDYVFDSDYELSGLPEVEEYIQSNGHLPGVPSATEIAEGGLNLGEMDAILMKKVEELTLYIIALHKQNEQLSREIEALKN